MKKRENESMFQKRLEMLKGNMSLDQFAKTVGLSRQTIGFYLSGERKPDIETLSAICERYAISADWLLGRDVQSDANPDNLHTALDSKIQDPDQPHRTCLVGGRRLAIFHGWFQNSYSTNAILVGEVGGQFSYPVAVVEYADGNVGVVPADHIRFTDGMEDQKE